VCPPQFDPSPFCDRQLIGRYCGGSHGQEKEAADASRACEYFWQTVPYLGRDPRNPNDSDSRGPDDAAVLRRSAGALQREF
jgi:hypothetical protein